MPNIRLLHQAVVCQYEWGEDGDLFMDVPPHENLNDLIEMAEDKSFWKKTGAAGAFAP